MVRVTINLYLIFCSLSIDTKFPTIITIVPIKNQVMPSTGRRILYLVTC
jgi:hypothetical protein